MAHYLGLSEALYRTIDKDHK